MTRAMLFLLAASTILAASAFAAVPQQINYQGYLTDTGGNAMDTTVAMTFKLYTDSTAGTQLWTETRPSVSVAGGLFNVRLGQLTALGDAVFNNAQVWLGITVGGNSEMTPRSRIVSVGYSYRVGTVDGASGGTVSSDLIVEGRGNFGSGNVNTGASAFVAGQNDTASGDYSSVGGGYSNCATAGYSVVGGGQYNTASGDYSTVGGGGYNAADGNLSTVGGGQFNDASGDYATVCGGNGNIASTLSSTVGGGYSNEASGNYSTVGGGTSNLANYLGTTIGGGNDNFATGEYTTVSGGYHNTTNSSYVTIGGGRDNSATLSYATVGGGRDNSAGGSYSTVGGGCDNTASASSATVSGGQENTASDIFATVPGGDKNNAAGAYSFAAGHRAKANHPGSFVWADSWDADFTSSAANQFNIRAIGGVRIYTNSNLTSGVTLAAGGNAWVAVSDSTKKRNIRLVDTREILKKVDELPIKQWSYKSQDPSIEHVGPMAQDFWKLFHLGEDSLGISTIDPDGIALAAIQELKVRTDEIEALKTEINQLKALMQNLLTSSDQNKIEQATSRGIER